MAAACASATAVAAVAAAAACALDRNCIKAKSGSGRVVFFTLPPGRFVCSCSALVLLLVVVVVVVLVVVLLRRRLVLDCGEDGADGGGTVEDDTEAEQSDEGVLKAVDARSLSFLALIDGTVPPVVLVAEAVLLLSSSLRCALLSIVSLKTRNEDSRLCVWLVGWFMLLFLLLVLFACNR